MLCHRYGEFGYVYLIIAFVASLGLSRPDSAAATAVFGENTGGNGLTATRIISTRGGKINSPSATTFSSDSSKIIEIPGNGTKSVPSSVLWKAMGRSSGRKGDSAAVAGQDIENLRARRNVMEKMGGGGGRKFGGVQSEDDILRLLSMIASKDGINFFPGGGAPSTMRTNEKQLDNAALLLNSFNNRHGGGGESGGFHFPGSSEILGSQSNYEDDDENDDDDDDDAIELGSFGGKMPPSFREDVSPVQQKEQQQQQQHGSRYPMKMFHQAPRDPVWSSSETSSSRRKPGNLRGGTGSAAGFDVDNSRSASLEKDWLDSAIPLYSHQQMKRMMKLSGGNHHHRYILMKRKREAGPHQLTQLLTGPQQLTEPNIPIFHRFVL